MEVASPKLPADAPPLVKQINNGNWLSQSEAEAMRDELYYQRAVHAYMTMLPALNMIGMRDGSEAVFGKGYNILPIWKDRTESRTWVPTPNADVIYSMSYLDLKESGPLVVAAPANVIGMFTDFFHTPEKNDGKTIYRLRVKDVPVNAFWSVSLYDAKGYYEKNPYNAYSINNITAKKEADGAVVIQFGGCDGKIANCLPIMDGWNYTVRLYRPKPEILNGKWTFPKPQPVG